MKVTLSFLWEKFRKDVLKAEDDSAEEIAFMRKIFYTGACSAIACEAASANLESMDDKVEGVKSLIQEVQAFESQMCMEALLISVRDGDDPS